MEWASIYVNTWMTDILDISRSVPLRHSPCSLYLLHDGTSYSRTEVRHDFHAKVPVSGISIRPDFLPCDLNIGTTSEDPGSFNPFRIDGRGDMLVYGRTY